MGLLPQAFNGIITTLAGGMIGTLLTGVQPSWCLAGAAGAMTIQFLGQLINSIIFHKSNTEGGPDAVA